MNPRCSLVMALAAGLLGLPFHDACWAAWHAQFSGRADATDPTKPHPRPGASYVSPPKPAPIKELDAAKIQAALDLHELQAEVFNQAFTAYREKVAGMMKGDFQALMAESSRLGAAPITKDAALPRQYEAYIDRREQFMEKLDRLESELFARLQPTLAEEQFVQLERVRKHRRRVHARADWPDYPGANIDLSEVLVEMMNAAPYEPLDQPAFDGLLLAYEDQATVLFEQHARANLKAVRDGPGLIADDPHHSSWFEQTLALSHPVDAAKRKLHELNRRYVTLLGEVLPAGPKSELLRAFNERAYPPVYPNPYDLRPVLDGLLALESLTDQQREELIGLAEAHRLQEQALSERMVRAMLAFKDQWAVRRVFDQEQFDGYKAKMTDLQGRRKALSNQTPETGTALLSETQRAEIKPAVAAHHKAASQHRAETSGMDFFP